MNKSKFSGIALLLIGVAIGGLVFTNFSATSEPRENEVYTAAPATTIAPAKDRTVSSLRDLNNAFVEIAETVNPTVVTVFTEKVYHSRGSDRPSVFDFFRDDFFSSPRRGRNQSPGREYRQQGLGSGVIVSPDGYILTNNHVIDDTDSIYVRTLDNRAYPAEIIGADPKTDIAVIKIEAKNLPAINTGDSDNLRVGEWVLAIGSPLSPDLNHTVTQGIVSAKGRSDVGLAEYEDFIQTDAAINPGNSGGALVNLDGELIGINTAIASRNGGFQGIGFAVPVNMTNRVMNSLIKHGKVIRGWLGVSIQNITEQMADAMKLETIDGVLVSEVVKGSPADKAGFQEEDVVVELKGEKVRNVQELRNRIAATTPGTTVNLKVIRRGSEKMLAVTLGELDGEPRAFSAGQNGMEDKLGFSVANLDRQLAERYNIDSKRSGVVVTAIERSSAAFRAGVREGDLIRKVNRQRVESISDFSSILSEAKAGENILLQITRESGSMYLAFKL